MLSDVQILAVTLFGEARGEPVEGRIAIGCVIRNRVEADLKADRQPDWWGEGYAGVCLAKQQFSCWNVNDPNYPILMAMSQHLLSGTIPDPILSECLWIAEGIVSGRVLRRVGNATHYYSTSLPLAPRWADGAMTVARVGHHIFLDGVK